MATGDPLPTRLSTVELRVFGQLADAPICRAFSYLSPALSNLHTQLAIAITCALTGE